MQKGEREDPVEEEAHRKHRTRKWIDLAAAAVTRLLSLRHSPNHDHQLGPRSVRVAFHAAARRYSSQDHLPVA